MTILKNNKTNFGRQASQPSRGVFWATVIGCALIQSSYQSGTKLNYSCYPNGTQLTGNGWSPHRSLLPQPFSPRIPSPFPYLPNTNSPITHKNGITSYQPSNIPAHIKKKKIFTMETDVNFFFYMVFSKILG